MKIVSTKPDLGKATVLLLISICSVFTQVQAATVQSFGEAKQARQPNILLIVADDLGYSDLGAYGGEIETPHLDQLASDGGITLTNFNAATTCSPTRSMLMSGTYNHQAGLGAMAEWTAENQRNQPGYEGYLNDRVVALPMLLRDVLPIGITGIVIAAYFSAIMSTAVSSLIASSGNFVNDILEKTVIKKFSSESSQFEREDIKIL